MTPTDTSNILQGRVVCLLPVECEEEQWWIQHNKQVSNDCKLQSWHNVS